MLGMMLVGAWLLIQQQCCNVYGDSGSRFRSPALVDPLMRRSPLEKNFMRFGRSSPSTFLRDIRVKENFMRFGRPSLDPKISSDVLYGEEFFRQNDENDITNDPSLKDAVSRQRRAKENFMRFGKRGNDKEIDKEDPQEIKKNNIQENIKFGKKDDSKESMEALESTLSDSFEDSKFMRNVRAKENFMRFGRDRERVGRNEKGKQDSFIRFGKSERINNDDYNDCDESMEKRKIRGRDNGFVRFGRSKEKFMRFGKKNDESFTSDQKDKAILIRVARDENGFMRSARQTQQDSSNGFIRFGRSDRQKRDTHKYKEVLSQLNSNSNSFREGVDPNLGMCKDLLNLSGKPATERTECKDNSCKHLYFPWPLYYQPSLYSVLPSVLSTPQVSVLPTSQLAHKHKRSKTGLQNFIRLG